MSHSSSNRPSICPVLILLAGLALPLSSHAQSPTLVRNINTVSTSNANANPSTGVRQGARSFFAANDGVHGTELWITDGTEAGTVLVRDIQPGTGNSNPTSITPIGTSQVVFAANDGVNGTELWISDGTEAGTQLLLDIQTGGSSTPSGITAIDASTVIFTANNGNSVNGNEIWKTDGTTPGTVMVRDIEPGPASSGPSRHTLFNGRLYFRAINSAEGGSELWSTDGTTANTTRIADINPAGDSNIDLLTVSGSRLYFIATIGGDTELYAFDGLSVSQVANINPSGSGLTSSSTLVDVSGTLFFAATDGVSGRELWKSDGLSVTQVIDLNPGANDGIGAGSAFAPIMVNRNGQLVFAGSDGLFGTELWSSNGTIGNAALVRDINANLASSNPTNMRIVGSGASARLFFSATDALAGQELFVSDGTPSGTSLVADLRAGGNGSPLALSDLNGVLLFSIEETQVGRELFRSDGTAAGTTLVKDIRQPNTSGASVATDLTLATTRAINAFNGRLVLRASDGVTGQELWTSDGTPAGTSRVGDINPGSGDATVSGLTDVGGRLFFTANDGASGTELHTLDFGGLPVRVKDIRPGLASGLIGAANLTNLNGLAIFVANDGSGDELWKSDGTESGTTLIQDINSVAGINASSPFTLGGRLYLTATGDAAVGSELWTTNGSTVTLAADLPPATAGSGPSNFAALGGKLYFAATADIAGAAAGNELWSFDPATGQASPVRDIRPGSTGSGPRSLVALGNFIYFSANDGTSGIELWRTDGSAAGTMMVTNLRGASDGLTNTTPLVPIGGKLYFPATDAASNTELWVYDPSTGNARMLAPTLSGINPGGSSSPTSITDVGGIAYFAANDGSTTGGIELWKSDGTDAGTVRVADLNPAGSSSPRNLRVVSSSAAARLFFTADNGSDGEELYVVTICRADFNSVGGVTVQDIFDFLAAYFSASPAADFNGVGGVTVQDIFDFLAAYFAGC